MKTFTVIHVLISLLGIAAGLVMLAGMLGARSFPGWTKIFLAATVATSVTGFFFPFHGFTPAIGLGLISLPILGLALYALYGRHLAGGWRRTYVITAVLALYFNVFVLIVQSFQKIPALKALAPTQSEPPFAVAQGLALLAFLAAGFLAVKRFPAPVSRAA